MKIIIAGAGEVGFHIAKHLSIESQNIVVIDTDKESLLKIENKLDVFTQLGDATSFKVLKEAKVKHADIFISVTEQQNTNLTSALLAKKLGAKKTIARINNVEFMERENLLYMQRMGIDSVISPETLAAREIYEVLEESVFSDAHSYERGVLYSYGVKLDTDAIVLNKTVKEVSDMFNGKVNFMPIAIIREGVDKEKETLIPRGETQYKENDKVYFLANPKAKKDLYKLLGKHYDPLKNVIILGGGRVAKKIARLLIKSKHSVVMIERNRKLAEELAEEFPKNLIINGDGRDGDILEEAGVLESDAFIAVTGRSETNIMSSLLAKNKGVKKTIALVENIDYINLSEEAGISTFVNKKLLAANDIYKHVRKGAVLDVFHITDLEAEFLEYKIDSQCKVANQKINTLNFPKKAIIGGVIRKDKGYIPNGNFELINGDKVVVFSLPEDLSNVGKLFSKE